MIAGTNITMLIGGSIAAYKSAELVRELVKKGARVHVVMSEGASKFITPLTLQTLSGHPVTTDLFDEERESRINHIWLADHAELILVAPATADIIARAAAGMANDALTTVLLASRAPVIVAPAMNVNMWLNPITKRNVETLKNFGMHFVEPTEGELACGWFGPGRFPELSSITNAISYVLSPKDLDGTHVIVAAGPTREPLDPVRYITNRSSGSLGFAIARVALWRGARVSLVAGPTSLTPPPGAEFHQVTTAVEMRDRVFDLASKNLAKNSDGTPLELVFMPTEVTDHMPASFSKTKLRQSEKGKLSIDLIPTPDILHELGDKRIAIEKSAAKRIKLVGFIAEAIEEELLLDVARKKLELKNADVMVVNAMDDSFESAATRVWVMDRIGRQEEIASTDEFVTAGKIISSALREV